MTASQFQLPKGFTEALAAGKFSAHSRIDSSDKDKIVVTVEYELTGGTKEFILNVVDLSSNQQLSQALDDILTEFECNPKCLPDFSLRPQDLQFWGFHDITSGFWSKKSPLDDMETLYIDTNNLDRSNVVLYSITEDGSQVRKVIDNGPVRSLAQFERMLRDAGWIGTSVERL